MSEAVAGRLEGDPRQFCRWSDECGGRSDGAWSQRLGNSAAYRHRSVELFTWRRKARQKAAALPTVADVDPVSMATTADCSTVDVIIDNTVISVNAAIDEPHLFKLIRAVRCMIPAGRKSFWPASPIDFRKGPDSLLALVRDSDWPG
ncbi:hypothetical protein HGP16_27065 [Rhizobium sp. P40RR-XXII]|uniref:hypothetical protein n=1 Tax=unclassified Rhizobium TaxID=2613769 RepID=UPI0014567E7A|nr:MULTISPECIES: hypothetical protein [unclassified Rhizobium]NLR88744.1 hypothetical protein [Rhizobium sp. P28RR-XV]NLS20199.1 hypothetical protein [Rhizobium sp. P40RR-XXII]